MNNMDQFKLDEKDKKILAELQKNSRSSFSEIGKKVGLPKTVVVYRVKRLVDSNFLTLFSTIINKQKLGYIYARLFLKFHNYNDKIEKALLDFLKREKGMHWIASLNGCYDFCIILLAKNIQELNSIYNQIIYKFSHYLLDKELSISIKKYYYPSRYIFKEETHQSSSPPLKEDKSIKLNEIDFKIINLLKQNSRMPLLDIAEKLNLAPQTARIRIKTLIANKIITSFKIRVNHKMLGLHHFHTFLNLSNINEKKEKDIIDFISSINSTIHIIKGTGKYDLEFESLLKSHFELYDILAQIKNKFPQNIQNSDSTLIYKIHEINTVKYSA